MEPTPKKSEYDLQAEAFAETHNTTMAALYLGHFPRFGEYATSQWQITLTRPGHGKPFVFTFSQSIQSSWQYRSTETFSKPTKGLPPRMAMQSWPKTGEPFKAWQFAVEPVKNAPKLYDILACLTKSNPGYFEEFCSEYGYSDDSISARGTWQAVVKEWREIERLFGDCLEELQEIN